MTFVASQALKDARLVGGMAGFLDADTVNPAYAVLRGAGTPLATMVFALPAVDLVAHELVFAQGDLSGDMIHTQGNADSFELFNGAGQSAGTGDVTDAAGSGALKVSGTTGTLLYAGARVVLDDLRFT